MSKKLKIVFYILVCLFLISIIVDIRSFYVFGIDYSIKHYNWFFGLLNLFITFFIFRKNTFILPISFLLMTYWLCTIPLYSVNEEGLRAIIYI